MRFDYYEGTAYYFIVDNSYSLKRTGHRDINRSTCDIRWWYVKGNNMFKGFKLLAFTTELQEEENLASFCNVGMLQYRQTRRPYVEMSSHCIGCGKCENYVYVKGEYQSIM